MLRHPYVTDATSQGSKGFVGEIIEAFRATQSGQVRTKVFQEGNGTEEPRGLQLAKK